MARPAHAESFLSKTPQCSIFKMLWGGCSWPSTDDTNEAQSQDSQGGSTSPSPMNAANPQKSTPQQTSGQPLSLSPIDITVEHQTVSIPRPEPLQSTSSARRASTGLQASVAYGAEAQGIPHASAPGGWVRPTSDGWYFLEIAWYWWAIGLAVLIGCALWVRRIVRHRQLPLVKEGVQC